MHSIDIAASTKAAFVAASLLLLAAPAQAQTAPVTKAAQPATTSGQLPEVTIAGNPLGTTDLIGPGRNLFGRCIAAAQPKHAGRDARRHAGGE